MMLAEMSGLSTFLLGLGILTVALVLRRSVHLSRRIRRRDVVQDVQETVRRRENSELAAARKAEIRLHEVARECEARISTRIAVLEQLIGDADERIGILRALISAERAAGRSAPLRMHPGPEIVVGADKVDGPNGQLAAGATSGREGQSGHVGSSSDAGVRPRREAQRAFVIHMAQAGFNAKEIAHCLDVLPSEVEAILRDVRRQEASGREPSSGRAEAA